MTTLVTVKQSLITKLKALTTVTSLLNGGAVEVRELEWNGTAFHYPNIRLRVDEFSRHTPGADCHLFDVSASIYAFGEDASSLKTDTIATAINDALDTKSFNDVATGTKIISIKTKQSGAAWNPDGGVWQSVLNLTFQAS